MHISRWKVTPACSYLRCCACAGWSILWIWLLLPSSWNCIIYHTILFCPSWICRVQSKSLLSAAVSMTWIPRSVCPLRLARTRPSRLLQLLDSSPMPTSSAKSFVNLWRPNAPMSKSVSLILFVRSRWCLCACVPPVDRSVFLCASGCVSLTHYLFHMTNPYLSLCPRRYEGDTAVPLPGYCLIFFCPV